MMLDAVSSCWMCLIGSQCQPVSRLDVHQKGLQALVEVPRARDTEFEEIVVETMETE